jgi:hypothetical protein
MSTKTIEEVKELLRNDDTQVGETFALIEQGITKASELVEKGSAKNTGVVAHHKYIIKAIVDGDTQTTSANLATYARRAIDRLLSSASAATLSEEAKTLLLERRAKLLEIISDKDAISNDTKELVTESAKLEDTLKSISNAIYVYTFPTYYRAGVEGDLDVRWLKVGLTTNSVWQRIVEQNRQTSMPEDPILIRIYHKEGIDLKDTEAKIMNTLRRVQFEQSSARHTKAGKEWFATNEDAIDAIAELLGLTVVRFTLNQNIESL